MRAGDKFSYNGKWEKNYSSMEEKISKIEGQVWFGLREILLNPICSSYYEVTEFRLSQFLKVLNKLNNEKEEFLHFIFKEKENLFKTKFQFFKLEHSKLVKI